MDIHRSAIKDFIMPKVKSVIVTDYYEGIKGMLESRMDFPYKDIFANPRLRTQTEITWATDSFTERPVLLTELPPYLKEKYVYALKNRIDAIELLVVNLKEEGSIPLSELLTKSISYIDECSVYCGDGNIVLVNWGLIPRHSDLNSGSIYRSGKFIGNWEKSQTFMNTEGYKHQEQQKETVIDSSAQELHKEPITPSTEEFVIPSNEESNEPATVSPESSPIADELDEPVETVGIHLVDSLSDAGGGPIEIVQPESSVSEVQPVTQLMEKKIAEEQVDKIPVEETAEKYVAKKEDTKKNKNDYSWSLLLKGFIRGLRFIFSKIGWLLLLVLLLLLTLFLCKGCQGPISQINPFYNPLPEHPVVLPVEDGGIGMSSDGKVQIATDRLNILLEKQGDDTMLQWAKAFKREYTSSEYRIFYYNMELYNLQIKVPSDKREQVKSEIQSKLKGFVFEVFDETVSLSESVSFNDPELNNQSHSWFLRVIGALDAWNITLGDPDIVIAVVDNGFDLSHPEFAGKVVHPYNVLTRNSHIYPIVIKSGENAHGTHVAATAVGNCNNGMGLMGVAPNCKLMPIQVGSSGVDGGMSNQAIMEGVMYAINQGADVINVSLGVKASEEIKGMSEGQQLNYISCSMRQEELMWSKIVEKAKQRNAIIVVSAGNDNVIAGIDPGKRNNSMIRVSAVDTSLGKADFSNYGRYAQLNREYSSLSAPGVDIYSAVPHGNYAEMQGTSMAAPVVSGAVALLKSVNRDLTTDQVIRLLKRTGREVNPCIGPLIDLSSALKGALKEGGTSSNCDYIARQITELRAKIDSLIQLCPDAAAPEDTLKYEKAVRDNHGLDGVWKTTTSLVSSIDQTPIELYMQFNNLSGVLTIKNQGNIFTAPLAAKILNGKIGITQHQDARSGTSQKHFLMYMYICESDYKGNLTCTATNSSGTVVFNLIRVK